MARKRDDDQCLARVDEGGTGDGAQTAEQLQHITLALKSVRLKQGRETPLLESLKGSCCKVSRVERERKDAHTVQTGPAFRCANRAEARQGEAGQLSWRREVVEVAENITLATHCGPHAANVNHSEESDQSARIMHRRARLLDRRL